MQLKQKLLDTELFTDNAYLDAYIKLIEDNKNTHKIKFKTQRHHIIPKYCFKLKKKQIDNSSENIVNLLYKDHFIAHLLLAMCSIDNYCMYNNFIALSYMNKNFNAKDLDCLQEEYEHCREECAKNNPMYNDVYKQIHDEAMRSKRVTSKISNTMKRKYKEGKLFTNEHKKNITYSLKDSIYVYNDEKITRVRTSKLQEYLDSGWKVYEKRPYAQLINKEPMTVKTNYKKMFATRSVPVYCILDTGEKFEFRNIRDATIWWFNNYHPFGNNYSECTLQRKIKRSIVTGVIEYGNTNHKDYKKITNIKWYKKDV